MAQPVFLLMLCTSWSFGSVHDIAPAYTAAYDRGREYVPIDLDWSLLLPPATDWSQVFLPNYNEEDYATALRVKYEPYLTR